jgi:imidazole glycerol phosphate synthase subunit HisF
MFYKNRLIPIIQIDNRRLIKTIQFSPKRYLGDPINAVRIFSLKGVNELVILDIGATKTQQIDFEYLKKLSAQAFIPLAYGGGIHSIFSRSEAHLRKTGPRPSPSEDDKNSLFSNYFFLLFCHDFILF